MAKKNKSLEETIERSPLIGDMPSTINPDKLEFSRFTDIQNEESGSNPIRILIYIVVVVGVGVATALIVRNLIVSNNTQLDTNSQDTLAQTEAPQTETAAKQTFVLSTIARPDNTVINIAANEDYRDSSSLTAGESELALPEVSLDKIDYTRLTTFSRLVFNFSGNDQRLPQTNISFSQTERKLTLNFGQIGNIDSGLKKNTPIDNFVRSASFIPASNSFEISVSEAFRYRVTNIEGNLILDIKSVREIEKPETTTATNNQTDSATTTPTNNQTNTGQTTAQPQAGAPAAPFYENEFGRGTQFVSSNVNTSTLIHNNYWAWDEGSFFEFSLGKQGMLGDDYVPNSKAYFDESVTDKVILVWEISNLSQAALSTKGTLTAEEIQSTIGISLAGANFIKVDFVELKDGKATYKIQLKNKADFKLLTQTTYDKTTQIISLRIKD